MFTNLPIKRGPHIVSTFAFVLQIFTTLVFCGPIAWAHLRVRYGNCSMMMINMMIYLFEHIRTWAVL